MHSDGRKKGESEYAFYIGLRVVHNVYIYTYIRMYVCMYVPVNWGYFEQRVNFEHFPENV